MQTTKITKANRDIRPFVFFVFFVFFVVSNSYPWSQEQAGRLCPFPLLRWLQQIPADPAFFAFIIFAPVPAVDLAD